MTCSHCDSEVPVIALHFCSVCGHLVTLADIRAYHAQMVAPRRQIEEERFELALREGGG